MFAAGNSATGAALSAGTVALAEGVLRAMLLTKLKMAAVVVLVIGVLGFGVGVLRPRGQAAQEQDLKPAEAIIPQRAEMSARLMELLKERIKVAEILLEARREAFVAGKREVLVDDVFDAARRVLTARLELTETKAERVAAWEAFLRFAKDIEAVVKAGFEAGARSTADYANAQYYRLDAEIGLERAKAK